MLNSSLIFSLGAGVPLTPDNVTKSFEKVKWELFCWCLGVPNSEKDEIEDKYLAPYRKELVDWWLRPYPQHSWRRLIQRLDKAAKKFENLSCEYAADNIRHNAEPVQGMFFTCTCSLQYVCC